MTKKMIYADLYKLRFYSYVESRPFYNETITNTDLYSTEESYPSYADERVTFWSIIKQIFNCGRRSAPSKASEKIVITEIFIYCK